MKAMKTATVLTATSLVVLLTGNVWSDLVYSVDFENPPHVVDQQVVTGAGTDRPYFVDASVIVRNSPADFTTQAASLEPAGSMNFLPGTVFTAGIALISWDLAMISSGSGGPTTAAISIDPSPGPSSSIFVYFQTDLSIKVDDNTVGLFTMGEQDHYDFVIDIDNGLYDFSFNGSLALNDQPLDSGWDLRMVSFGRENLEDPTYAVDNFEWHVIPEPSTALLVLLGGFFVVVQRIRRNQ
jgi:hypothetical protein